MRNGIRGLLLIFVLCGMSCRTAEPVFCRTQEHAVDGYPAWGQGGRIRVLVEIPAGTNQKWEALKDGSGIAWELKDGKRRVIQYLPYPANYGMIPQTLLPKEQGGDGDPLDAIVLGPAVKRGSVVQARVIGVLRLKDGGETDNKILSVTSGSPMDGVKSISDLARRFPGVLKIIETWFSSYKGPGEMVSDGYDGPMKAGAMVKLAHQAWEETARVK